MPYPNEQNENASRATVAAEGAAQAWESTKEKATDALETGERYVRENPIPSMLSIFGFGLVVGMLVGWSIARPDDDDYSDIARRLGRDWRRKLHLD